MNATSRHATRFAAALIAACTLHCGGGTNEPDAATIDAAPQDTASTDPCTPLPTLGQLCSTRDLRCAPSEPCDERLVCTGGDEGLRWASEPCPGGPVPGPLPPPELAA